MKAILKVHRNSAYSIYNGYTFEIKQIFGDVRAMYSLLINGNKVDFTANEIMIVDFQEEYKKCCDTKINKPYAMNQDIQDGLYFPIENTELYKHLTSYAKINKIKM
jgi:hypothetical protein